MEDIMITLPLPPTVLSANANPHRMVKARATKSYKAAAYYSALDVISRNHIPVPFDEIVIYPTFFFRQGARRDRDNWAPALKAAQDGIAKAGFVKDDTTATTMPPEGKVAPDNPRVELVITEATGTLS